jgi:hypothetical protein
MDASCSFRGTVSPLKMIYGSDDELSLEMALLKHPSPGQESITKRSDQCDSS